MVFEKLKEVNSILINSDNEKKQIWMWASRIVFDNWNWFVIKKQRDWGYEWCNQYELDIYKLFDKKWLSHLLWKIDLEKSNDDELYMEKLNIFEMNDIESIEKELFDKLYNKSEFNKSLLELLKFFNNISKGMYLDSLNLDCDSLLSEKIEYFNIKYPNFITWDFKYFIDILSNNDWLYDFFHIWRWLENLGYDNLYNLKILDFWG